MASNSYRDGRRRNPSQHLRDVRPADTLFPRPETKSDRNISKKPAINNLCLSCGTVRCQVPITDADKKIIVDDIRQKLKERTTTIKGVRDGILRETRLFSSICQRTKAINIIKKEVLDDFEEYDVIERAEAKNPIFHTGKSDGMPQIEKIPEDGRPIRTKRAGRKRINGYHNHRRRCIVM
ncbi:hypothetical protein MKZ38_010381 [Zalerion maritima]|uniref:Uncharacterized protein n=1 Tax=Zalerion maritima TaxID=339359 RepID=A0AAD5WU73_9PEZI|nr:hypothetical protein MKZ38_010381 [Zalerion maritima]